MGEMIMIDGSGLSARFTEQGVVLEPTTDRCVSCNDDRLLHDGQYLVCAICHCRQQERYHKMTLFKCNGCSRKTEFLWLEQLDTPDGFKAYQCMDCGCVGIKNIAEALSIPDSTISRCSQCGSWQFKDLPCHTCKLIGAK